MLERNSTLTSLQLSHNDTSDEGAESLAAGLKVNRTLEDLGLIATNLHDQGSIAIARSLMTNQVLLTLRMNENPLVGKEGRKLLQASAATRPTFRVFV